MKQFAGRNTCEPNRLTLAPRAALSRWKRFVSPTYHLRTTKGSGLISVSLIDLIFPTLFLRALPSLTRASISSKRSVWILSRLCHHYNCFGKDSVGRESELVAKSGALFQNGSGGKIHPSRSDGTNSWQWRRMIPDTFEDTR